MHFSFSVTKIHMYDIYIQYDISHTTDSTSTQYQCIPKKVHPPLFTVLWVLVVGSGVHNAYSSMRTIGSNNCSTGTGCVLALVVYWHYVRVGPGTSPSKQYW